MEPYFHNRKASQKSIMACGYTTQSSQWDQANSPHLYPGKSAPHSFTLPYDEAVNTRRSSRRSTDSVATDIDCTPATVPDPSAHDIQSATRRYETEALPARDKFSPSPLSPPRSASASSANPAYPAHSDPWRDVRKQSPSHTPPLEPRREHRRPVMAMPGTMSSRPTRSDPPPRNRRRAGSAERQSRRSSPPLGSRFRSAFKDIFQKSSPDPTTFERIEDKHWSDDW